MASRTDTSDEDSIERAIRHSAATSDLPKILIDNPATRRDPEALQDDVRTSLSFAALYAEDDVVIATKLLNELGKHLKSSRIYIHELWERQKILAGQHQQDETNDAIDRSDYFLILISPTFLHDRSLRPISERVVATDRPCIIVELSVVDDDRHDLREFKELHRFRDSNRAWTQCKPLQKAAFAFALFKELEDRLKQYFSGDGEDVIRAEDQAREIARLPERCEDNEASRTNLRARDAVNSARRMDDYSGGLRRSGLGMLLEWALDPKGAPYACVLGEFGIGKTTLLKRFTQELLLRRYNDSHSAPLPIFLDLKTYVEAIEGSSKPVEDGLVRTHASLPLLEQFLDELLQRTWKHTGPPMRAKQLLRLVREAGALVIIDGLDEKLVHLNEVQGAALIRTLWGILPPDRYRLDARKHRRRPGRVIISCRSHYFPTVQSQNATFTGNYRDQVRADDYFALIVLPFSETQIKNYLEKHFGPVRGETALKLIKSVHNLAEVAQRPLFLGLLQEQVEYIEQLAAQGQPIYGVTLYDHMIEACLHRDEGKHKLYPTDKIPLMEAVAAAMWSSGDRAWPWPKVFSWLSAHLAGNPALSRRYLLNAQDETLVAEDFRTATLVVRPDQGNDFRFAHSSLHEYFLARWLYRALCENSLDGWDMAMPSDETLHFLGQLLIIRSDPSWRDSMEMLLEFHRPRATIIAFHYWQLAIKHGYPQPAPARVCLPGEQLNKWTILGPPSQIIDLRNADLRGASLRQARLSRISLAGADLRNIDAAGATFEDVSIEGAKLDGAKLMGTVWRDCETEAVHGIPMSCWDSAWIRTPPPPHVTSVEATWASPPHDAVPGLNFGHSGVVRACAFSPNGRTFATAAGNIIKLWDSDSGHEKFSFLGHTGYVKQCAFNHDGSIMISVSSDHTVKLWDAASGRMKLSIPIEGANACATSPNNQYLVIGCKDHRIRLLDLSSSKMIEFLGHRGVVNTCAFSDDGQQIISGSSDYSVRLWDILGNELRCLNGHRHHVRACAFSTDGRWILSASDNTINLWSLNTGRLQLSLRHTSWVKSCNFSYDNEYIVATFEDASIRRYTITGTPLSTFIRTTSPVTASAYSPSGRRILVSFADSSLRILDADSGYEQLALPGFSNWVSACAFSNDCRYLLSARGASLEVWDATNGQFVRLLTGHRDSITACSRSPDGKHVASASNDHAVKVWDPISGDVQATFSGHTSAVRTLAFSPDGKYIASASSDNTLLLWSVTTPKDLRAFENLRTPLTSCAFDPDGRYIVSASGSQIILWDVATLSTKVVIPNAHSDTINSCMYNPKGNLIVTSSRDGTLKIWDSSLNHTPVVLKGHLRGVNACVFSPDGETILSASDDHTLILWDIVAQVEKGPPKSDLRGRIGSGHEMEEIAPNPKRLLGKSRLILSGHTDSVSACAFSSDGNYIVSASHDGTMRLWNTRTGILRCTMWSYDHETASFDDRAILWASRNAWRYLCWRAWDSERRAWRIYPAEANGSLVGS